MELANNKPWNSIPFPLVPLEPTVGMTDKFEQAPVGPPAELVAPLLVGLVQEKLENVNAPFVMVVLEVTGRAYAPVADRMPATLARRSFLIDLTSNVWTAELVRVPTTACPAPLQVQVTFTKHDACQLEPAITFIAKPTVCRRA